MNIAVGFQTNWTDTSPRDTDGIPDWWRLKYFGHATGLASDQSRAGDDPHGRRTDQHAEVSSHARPDKGRAGRNFLTTAVTRQLAASARVEFPHASGPRYTPSITPRPWASGATWVQAAARSSAPAPPRNGRTTAAQTGSSPMARQKPLLSSPDQRTIEIRLCEDLPSSVQAQQTDSLPGAGALSPRCRAPLEPSRSRSGRIPPRAVPARSKPIILARTSTLMKSTVTRSRSPFSSIPALPASTRRMSSPISITATSPTSTTATACRTASFRPMATPSSRPDRRLTSRPIR